MGNGMIPLMVVAMVPIIAGTIGQRALNKRNAPTNLDYPDYPTKYDEYPVSNSEHSRQSFATSSLCVMVYSYEKHSG